MRYLMIGFLLINANNLWATDFGDGIAYEEGIDDTIRADHNIPFLVSKSKSKRKDSDSEEQINSGVGNIEFGIGSELKNVTIINLSDNEDAVAVGGN